MGCIAQARAGGREALAAQALPGQGVDQIAVDIELVRVRSAYATNQHIVVAGSLPIRRLYLRDAGWGAEHDGALHGAEASAALKIMLDHRGYIKAAIGRHRAPEGHDRDRDRVGDALRDIDLQRGTRRQRCQRQQPEKRRRCVPHVSSNHGGRR